MTEDHLGQEIPDWLAETGYSHLHGSDIAPDGSNPERADGRQVVQLFCLREANGCH